MSRTGLAADPMIPVSRHLSALESRTTMAMINIFNGEHFSTWKRRMVAAMEAKELDAWLEHDPSELTNDADKLKAKKTYATLIQYVSDEILTTLQAETTAAGIWQKLTERYGSPTTGTARLRPDPEYWYRNAFFHRAEMAQDDSLKLSQTLVDALATRLHDANLEYDVDSLVDLSKVQRFRTAVELDSCALNF
ncbi:hypothetical protein JTE90_024666 [Oedothorax gibbosus]|uniref:Retrotransposon Copia-like N-terminal domain-containing protein n=1 Tax=Oedothorax gibbosus TaxID=931172 RepID=A0AAV6TLV4_9ARAC|nr:hypothetical protein JTE90_024666 [Oedothorax gibbosus]